MKGVVTYPGHFLHGRTVTITETRDLTHRGIDLGECHGVQGSVNGLKYEFWLPVANVRILRELAA